MTENQTNKQKKTVDTPLEKNGHFVDIKPM